MDEQTIQQPINQEPEQSDFDNYEADNDVMEDTENSRQDEVSFPDPTDVDDSPDVEIAVDNDGELKFSDDFFGDIKDEPQEPEPPKFYTDAELQNIPYEQWEFDRMPEEVRRYANILNQQTMARQRQQAIQQRQPQTFINEVKQYTPKELADEGQKLAMEKLGITEDDWDEYEPEHQAALRLAENELLQKRNAEVMNYQRNAGEFKQLQDFNARLVAQPDFKDFDAWHSRRLQQRGLTQQQIDAGLMQLANTQGYGAVQQVLSEWYREFQSERTQARNRRPQPRRNLRPPVLEGTRGGDGSGRSYNMRNFGEMDSDAQAKALMDMGIV